MATIQTLDPGLNRHQEFRFRVWCTLISHEYSHVEEFYQNHSWVKIKEDFSFSCGGQKIPFSLTVFWWRNLETDASDGEAKGKPSLGYHSFLWCDSTRRLRKTYSPDLVGGGQSLQLHNLIDHLRFYVCSSARRFVHSLLNLSSNRMGLRCEVQCTPLPLELWECVEPLICRECGDTLVPSYKFREGRDTL